MSWELGKPLVQKRPPLVHRLVVMDELRPRVCELVQAFVQVRPPRVGEDLCRHRRGILPTAGKRRTAAIQHACSECGYTTGKWLGKCPSCESWGTLVEERTAAAPKGGATRAAGKPLLRLVEVEAADAERI